MTAPLVSASDLTVRLGGTFDPVQCDSQQSRWCNSYNRRPQRIQKIIAHAGADRSDRTRVGPRHS